MNEEEKKGEKKGNVLENRADTPCPTSSKPTNSEAEIISKLYEKLSCEVPEDVIEYMASEKRSSDIKHYRCGLKEGRQQGVSEGAGYGVALGIILGVGIGASAVAGGVAIYNKIASNKSSLGASSDSSAGNGTSVSDALCAGLFGRR